MSFNDLVVKKQRLYEDIYRLDVDLMTNGKRILKQINELMTEAQSLTFKYLGT